MQVSNISQKTGIVQLLEPEFGIAPGQLFFTIILKSYWWWLDNCW